MDAVRPLVSSATASGRGVRSGSSMRAASTPYSLKLPYESAATQSPARSPARHATPGARCQVPGQQAGFVCQPLILQQQRTAQQGSQRRGSMHLHLQLRLHPSESGHEKPFPVAIASPRAPLVVARARAGC